MGGGREVSTSLRELTRLCRKITGNEIPIHEAPETNPVDIPLYVSDSRKAERSFGWRPTKSVETIVEDIHRWIQDGGDQLRSIF